jgi:flagellar basal-body rod protein FlgB
MANLFDKTTLGLSASLRMRQLRHNVISSNIANAETPNYHAKKLDFEEALGRALDVENQRGVSVTHGDHFPISGEGVGGVRPDIYENPEGAVNNDGNTVDLEREMTSLSENNLLYKSALQLINKKMAALKYVATEGGGR